VSALPENDDGWTAGFHTASDGYRWSYRHYHSRVVPRAHIVGVHGVQSHAGWYGHSSRRFAGAGFEVSFLDRRGSGRNEAARGDTPSFRRLLGDIAEYLRDQRSKSDRPIFLMAISWGAKLAVGLARRHPGLTDGLIFVAPGFSPRVAPTPRERLGILWAHIIDPQRLFPVPLNEPELFTSTPRWLEFLRNDPLAVRRATARFFLESVRLDWYLRFAVPHITMPVLTLLAEKDRIIDNSRTRALLGRLPTQDQQIIEYPGAHHTLEFEPDPEPFIGDILSWLDRHTTQARNAL
jgi:alpha-beta hydrolase superfamily lysophospholipase